METSPLTYWDLDFIYPWFSLKTITAKILPFDKSCINGYTASYIIHANFHLSNGIIASYLLGSWLYLLVVLWSYFIQCYLTDINSLHRRMLLSITLYRHCSTSLVLCFKRKYSFLSKYYFNIIHRILNQISLNH